MFRLQRPSCLGLQSLRSQEAAPNIAGRALPLEMRIHQASKAPEPEAGLERTAARHQTGEGPPTEHPCQRQAPPFKHKKQKRE